MFENVEKIRQEIRTHTLKTNADLEKFRMRFISKKSVVNSLMQGIKEVSPEEKKAYGQAVNTLKKEAEVVFQEGKKQLEAESLAKSVEKVDVTLDPAPVEIGSRHPVSLVRNRIVQIFTNMGFNISEGPEIEDDWHNFTALNTPEDHPARDMQDTFYIGRNPDHVLRTQTSSVQVRMMEGRKPPIKTISPGRVYRNETISARAHCFFHQVEGLYIDEDVSFADLKQTLYSFARQMFGDNTAVRFRPSYFPFTEPSAEMDVTCFICGGSGCNVCKYTSWVEILGCGMVDPQVLTNCGIDPERYSGFAFGMGIERIVMLKYQIDDIRVLFENDIRFLRQFKGEL